MITLEDCTREVAAAQAMPGEAAWRLSEGNLTAWGGVIVSAYFPGSAACAAAIAHELLLGARYETPDAKGYFVAPIINSWCELDFGGAEPAIYAIRGVALWRADIAAVTTDNDGTIT